MSSAIPSSVNSTSTTIDHSKPSKGLSRSTIKFLGGLFAILGAGIAFAGGALLVNTNDPAYIALLLGGTIVLSIGMAHTDHPGF